MKKRLFKYFVFILLLLIFIPNVYADGFCEFDEVKRVLKIVGYAILMIRIIVPVLLIIFTMLDLMKYYFLNDDNEKKPEYKDLPKRILGRVGATIFIFLMPTIISLVLNAVDDGKLNESVSDCSTCLSHPSDCKTTNKSTLPDKPDMKESSSINGGVSGGINGANNSINISSVGYNWKYTNNYLVYLDNSGNVIKNTKFTVNGVTYRADKNGKVTPNVDKPNTTANFSAATKAIINVHRYDFDVDSFNKIMKNYGGYKNYIKSLGGVFTKYADFNGKITTAKELQEVTEYTIGIMTIWGFDYANYNPAKYGKWGKNGSTASDAFYPGNRNNGKKENWTKTGIDSVASGSGNGMTVHCNLGVDYILRKAGLMKANDPESYYNDSLKKMAKKKITNSNELQPGDIINYFKNGSNYHTNIVVSRNDKEGTFTMCDLGHYFTNSAGNCMRTRKLGQSPISNRSWVGLRLFNLK